MNPYQRSLHKSSNQQVIGGVAAGIADYFHTDPTLIRVLFVIMAMVGGGGLLIYIILWIALPSQETKHFENLNSSTMENNPENEKDIYDFDKNYKHRRNNGNLLVGLILIAIGVMFLVDRFVPHINFGDLWPIILVVAGIALLSPSTFKSKNKDYEK